MIWGRKSSCYGAGKAHAMGGQGLRMLTGLGYRFSSESGRKGAQCTKYSVLYVHTLYSTKGPIGHVIRCSFQYVFIC